MQISLRAQRVCQATKHQPRPLLALLATHPAGLFQDYNHGGQQASCCCGIDLEPPASRSQRMQLRAQRESL